MKNKIMLAIYLLTFMLSTAYAGELVRGWYDPENQWFVFQWEREGSGTITGIIDPPNKIEPVIGSSTNYDTATSSFVYRYIIANKKGVQPLFKITIDCFANVTNSTTPSEEWDSDWTILDVKKSWSWVKTMGDNRGIEAGDTASGFSISSDGIPAILNATFVGYRRVRIYMPGDYDSDEVWESYDRVYAQLMEKYKEEAKFKQLKTVAPNTPPKAIVPTAFMDNLISMTTEAEKLGWITNPGIARSLQAKLDAARKKFASGNNGAAANILKALINEADAQACASHDECRQGQHLTPEAHALIKYNAQYLLDHVK